jgi:fumarylacetoacetase
MDSFLTAEWSRKSWVESANDQAYGFPLQSLPYCVFVGESARARIGIGIGSFVLDLHQCAVEGLLDELPDAVRKALETSTLNALVASGTTAQVALRGRLMDILDKKANDATRKVAGGALAPMAAVTYLKPIDSANFTDFYASMDHATRVGRLFRPEQPLLPNYKYVPIGYHGRASSLIVSGTPVRRPRGQRKVSPDGPPVFEPTRFLDYEVEVGMYIGGGNTLGEPIDVLRAGQHIFGLSLVNDWSARDLQSWEYQPLGPFLAKSFATSVSPWVVPIAALAPFRVPAMIRRPEDPAPLDYLLSVADQQSGAIDLTLEAYLLTPSMRAAGMTPHRLSSANLRDLYWTPAQLIAHHTSNGCNLLPGDLLATGTVSGPELETAGCLLELTSRGAHPVSLPNGESRTALEDGDELILRGVCRREGFPDVSLGECRAAILPAV